MRNYLLISGTWLLAAALTAFAYSRLAAFGARADAHLLDPRPRSRRAAWALPGMFVVSMAMGCAAAVLVADFTLEPEARPVATLGAAPAQSVRMAAPPARERSRAPQRATRAAGAAEAAEAATLAAARTAAGAAGRGPRVASRPMRREPPPPVAVAATSRK